MASGTRPLGIELQQHRMDAMPSPGYDYSRGYLSYAGSVNQFAYADDDFAFGFGFGDFSYGGPYYDARYRNLYYNPSFSQINLNLWVFIDNSHFSYDNYADYELGPDYARYVFDRRLVRISNQRLDRTVLERVVRQRVQETPVEVRQLQTDKQTVRMVVPKSQKSLEEVRKNSKKVVEEVIAPAFAEKQKARTYGSGTGQRESQSC
jgi:hypothetical protein